jgi:PAS domain S-box-containing protein
MTADSGHRDPPSDQRFRLLVESVVDYAIFLLDPEGRVSSWNTGAQRIKGYRAEEILGQHFSRFYPEEDIRDDKPGRELREARAQGRFEDEGWRLRKDDSRFWANVIITALFDEAGQLIGFAKVTRDLTERRQAEEQRLRLIREQADRQMAEEGERRYRVLAETIPQIVWTARPDGTLDYWNRRWFDYTGLTPGPTEGWAWEYALHPDDVARCRDLWEGAIAAGEAHEIQFRLRRGLDGAYRWHLGRALPVRGADGRIDRWFGTCTDIDDQKRAEQALRQAKETAEAASRSKDQFLAMLSHELRTPLTPVLLAVTALLEEPRDLADLTPTLEMIRRSIELESRLIDDLLVATQMGEGPLRLAREVVDIHDLIHQALDACRGELHDAQILLEEDLRAGEHHADADPAQMQGAFQHLIRNAAKFTPAGGTLAIRSRNAAGPAGPRLVVELADTGVGIDPEVLPRIFNTFEQGEAGHVRHFGGLGLGLPISRRLVEAHGGTLTAASAGPSLGATFTVVLDTLPAPSAAGAGRPPAPAPRPTERRELTILLVEDDSSTLRVLTRLLQAKGCAVMSAGSVASALELADAEEIDLVVSDIGLPDGTGWDLMRQLRTRGAVRGIALTGFGLDQDVRQSEEAGFVAHLTKPVDFRELEATIQQVASDLP